MFITTLVSLNTTFSCNYSPCGYLNETESDFLFKARSRGGAPIGVIAKFQTVAPADKYLTHRSNSVHSHSPISGEASDSRLAAEQKYSKICRTFYSTINYDQ